MKSLLLCLRLALVILLAVNSATASMMHRHMLPPDDIRPKKQLSKENMMNDGFDGFDIADIDIMERLPGKRTEEDSRNRVKRRAPEENECGDGNEMNHIVGKSLHDATDDYGNSSDVEDEEAAYANTDDDDEVEEEE
uniref:Secreted phosphoprotein 1 n=1 Tax=Mesocestoides corti TaxID=53468 RepID=A0A5K3FY40_MESCO